MKKGFLITFFLALSIHLFAQHSQQHGDVGYLYAIDQAHFKLYNEKYLEKNLAKICNTIPIDTIPYKDVSGFRTSYKKPGAYLLVWIEGTRTYFDLFAVFPWKVKPIFYPVNGGVMITDWANQPLKDLDVFLDFEKLHYDPYHECYAYSQRGQSATLYISNGKLTQQFTLHPNSSSYRDYGDYSSNNSLNDLTGFVAMNKPVYKQGDTLKVKVYLCKKNGKPYTKDIDLRISELYSSPLHHASLKPVSPGAYVYEYIVSDSLKIDKTYDIYIYSKKDEYVGLHNTFRVEDYKLDEIDYNFRPLHTNYYKEDSLYFQYDAFDKNHNVAFDAEVDIIAMPYYIGKIFSNSVYFPDTLYQGSFKMQELNNGILQLPSSLKTNYPANYSLKVIATCRNSNNELKKIETSIHINHKPAPFQTYISNQYIHFSDQKGLADSIQISKYPSFEVAPVEWKIHKKDSVKLDPTASSFLIKWDDQLKYINMEPSMFPVQVTGVMKVDTLFLSLYNPAKVPVKMYSLKGETKHGLKETSTQTMILKRNEQVTIYYEYKIGADKLVSSKSFMIDDKNIFIKNDLPDKVYPGEHMTLNISSYDYKNNPLQNTNFTVLSVNAAFQESNVPSVPSFGKQAADMSTSPKAYLSEYNPPRLNKRVDSTWVARFGLEDRFYYHSLISKNKFNIYKIPNTTGIKSSFAQIILLDNSRAFLTPAYVEENNEIVYYNASTTDHIKTTAGTHQYRIRTDYFYYDLPTIQLTDDSITYIVIKPTFFARKGDRKKIEIDPTVEQTRLKQKFMTLYNKEGWVRPTFVSNYQETYCIPSIPLGSCYFGPFTGEDSAYVEQFNGNTTSFLTNSLSKNKRTYWPRAKEDDLDLGKFRFPISNHVLTKPFRFNEDIAYTYQSYSDWMAWHHDKFYGIFDAYPYSSYYSTSKARNKVEFVFADKDFKASGTILMNLYTEKVNKYRGHIHQFYNLDPGSYRVIYVGSEIQPLLQDSFFTNGKGILLKYIDTTASFGLFPSDTDMGLGSVFRGVLMEKESMEPLPFATVMVKRNGVVLGGTNTDLDGKYMIHVPPGDDISIVFSCVGYAPVIFSGIQLAAKGEFNIVYLDGSLMELNEYVVNTITTIESIDITTVQSYSSLGVANASANLYFTSGRTEDYLYIDGVKTKAENDLTTSLLTLPGVITGGTPAKFGDMMGGIVNLDVAGYNFSHDLNPDAIYEANKIRTFFADNAIWQPNLISQQNGTASCQVRFPENITSWETYILAMHPKGLSGQVTVHTKSFKPVVASLYLPDFVIEGDSFEVVNKVMNYTSIHLDTKNKLSMGEVNLMQVDTNFKDFYIHKKTLWASGGDSIRLSFSTILSNGYIDGEKRVIPVYKKGINVSVGKMFPAWKNASIRIDSIDGQKELEIEVFNGFDNLLVKEADYLLFHYRHACNEQISSKLVTAICAAGITTKGWKKDLYDLQIENMISLLRKNQNDEGGWGWWNKTKTNVFMTLKVGEALKFAEENGYEVKLKHTLTEAIPALLKNAQHRDDTLAVIKLAGLYNVPKESVFDLKTIYTLTMPKTDYQKLMVMEIKQLYGQSFNISELISMKKETLFGNYYWGVNSYYLYDNATYMTSMALSIMKRSKTGEDTLIKVLGYLLEKRVNGHFANTMVSAKMSLFFHDYLGTLSKTDPRIVINQQDTIQVKDTYRKIVVSPNVQSIDIITDKLIYVGYSQEKSLAFDAVKEDLFSIKNEWLQDGQPVTDIRAGKFITLHTKVTVKKDAQYMSLEIPIPAGCTYAEKPTNSNSWNNRYEWHRSYEVHREYFRDRIVIYYENIPAGTYDLNFKLECRFKGTYTVNNALMENMYFPQLNGYNALQSIRIQ